MATAQEPCGLTATLFHAGFEITDPIGATLPAAGTALAVSIDPAFAGITVDTSSVTLFGTWAGPPAAGVAVNGQSAQVEGNYWLATLPLADGANTLTATVTALTGATLNTAVTVTRGSTPPPVQWLAEAAQTYSPAWARFGLQVRSDRTLVSASLDYDGNNQADATVTDPESVMTWQYALPGFYRAKATVTLDDGNPNTALEQVIVQTPVLVQNLTLTRLTLCHVFGQMKQRLAAADIEGALKTLHPRLQPSFQSLWTTLGSSLPTVANQLGTVADGTLSTDFAEYLIARPIAGQPDQYEGFRIQFDKGLDGVWRIGSM